MSATEDVVNQDVVEKPRSTWGRPLEFILSCLTYAVGLGNVWRFPYLCYRNGGGVFIVAYAVMLVLMGMPIFLLELLIGQYSGFGPEKVFTSIAPIFSGVGYANILVITLITIYYMVIIGWTFFYFFASFTSELGYGSCMNDFNSKGCFSAAEEQNCAINYTFYDKKCSLVDDLCKDNGYISMFNKTHCVAPNNTLVHLKDIITRTLATEEYFNDYVLGLRDVSWENFGGMQWKLLGCLFAAWVICFLCCLKGVKTSGKVVYFTTLFPYVVLTALVIQGAILEGAKEGVLVYIVPEWSKLLEARVWANAASQTFYSFGISCGSLITLASYNDFKNNCIRDAFVVTVVNLFTSVYAGFAIFSMLGYLADQMGVPVSDVADDGPGLAFVAYPEVILRLPVPPIWSFLFFFMLIVLGLGSQFAGIEAICCLILDKWTNLRKYQTLVMGLICLGCFLVAIPMCFQGGIYLFTLMEWNTASWAIMLIGLCEVISVAWVYNCNKFMGTLVEMGMAVSKLIRWFWWVCWVIITPVALLGLFVFQMVELERSSYGDYIFPVWADILGILIGVTTLAPLIPFAIYTKWSKGYTFKELFLSTPEWHAQGKKRSQTKPSSEEVPETIQPVYVIDEKKM